MVPFVPGAVSEGHKSRCKITDPLLLGTDLIPAQVNQWFHMMAFTLIGSGYDFICERSSACGKSEGLCATVHFI